MRKTLLLSIFIVGCLYACTPKNINENDKFSEEPKSCYKYYPDGTIDIIPCPPESKE